MTSALNKDSKIVLKLDLGRDGVRRISHSKLWDESLSTVSYDRLVELALDFKNLKLKAVQNGRITLSTTYIDEDGDEITISSDEELAEAFVQFVNSNPPVVWAKVVIVRSDKIAPNVQKQDRGKQGKNANNHAIPLENLIHKLDTKSPLPPMVKINHVPSDPSSPKSYPKGLSETTDSAMAAGFDPNFIHGRHTCDGCLSTPIFGIRYHAMSLPDYDLCSNCYANYKGAELQFKPMQLESDRHLYSRWQRRQMRRCRPVVRTTGLGKTVSEPKLHNIPPCAPFSIGTQTKKVIDNMDDALKEAIRRSLVDAWPKNTKEDEASVSTKTTETESMTEKERLPEAQVVEVTAGNEYTQKALDTMDVKAKEALNRSLNECFARRVNHPDGFSILRERKNVEPMDAAMKEAIRRRLTNFFSSRLPKENKKEGEACTPEPKEESNHDIKRAQEILETMDLETKETVRRSLNEFFASRLKKNETKDDSKEVADGIIDDEDGSKEVADGIIDDEDDSKEVADVIIGDEDDDLYEGAEGMLPDNVDDRSEGAENMPALEDNDDQSKSSEVNGAQDEWQMVTEDDDMIAMAAQMLGSALFQSDASLPSDSL